MNDSNKKSRTTETPKIDPTIIAVLLFDVIAVAGVVTNVVVDIDNDVCFVSILVVEAFSQRVALELTASTWQMKYCKESQRVQVAEYMPSREPGFIEAT